MIERKYKNPPIVEALCEFRFFSTQPWDFTIPGLIYERVKGEFPEKQQRGGIIGFEWPFWERKIDQVIPPFLPWIQFWKKDKTALIQIAPDILVINQLKPYPSWGKFKSLILNNFGVYKEIANPRGLKKITLRYINKMDFDKKDFELKKYFQYFPSIPDTLPRIQDSFFVSSEFSYEEGEKLILTLGNTISPEPNVVSVTLDISYLIVVSGHLSFDDIPNWLEKAHERIRVAFETSITDETRIKFEEEKP